MKVVLASNSPRRKQLLKKIVEQFDVHPSSAEENSSQTDPKKYCQQLAKVKAWDVYESLDEKADVVIGCDTVVDLDGTILGKPQTAAQAVQMLKSLSDKTHQVHTGVCMIVDGTERCFVESTQVTFRRLSDLEILQYVNSGAPMDKAGAYGIQECGFVEGWQGSYDNVVGFPTERIAEIFKKYKR